MTAPALADRAGVPLAIGQRVEHCDGRIGTIIGIGPGRIYPVRVKWDDYFATGNNPDMLNVIR